MQYCLLCLNLPQPQPATVQSQDGLQVVCRKAVHVKRAPCHFRYMTASNLMHQESYCMREAESCWSPCFHAYHGLMQANKVRQEMCRHDGLMHTVLLDVQLWPRHPCLSEACSCAPSDPPVPVLPSPSIFCVTQAYPGQCLTTHSVHAANKQAYCKLRMKSMAELCTWVCASRQLQKQNVAYQHVRYMFVHMSVSVEVRGCMYALQQAVIQWIHPGS